MHDRDAALNLPIQSSGFKQINIVPEWQGKPHRHIIAAARWTLNVKMMPNMTLSIWMGRHRRNVFPASRHARLQYLASTPPPAVLAPFMCGSRPLLHGTWRALISTAMAYVAALHLGLDAIATTDILRKTEGI